MSWMYSWDLISGQEVHGESWLLQNQGQGLSQRPFLCVMLIKIRILGSLSMGLTFLRSGIIWGQMGCIFWLTISLRPKMLSEREYWISQGEQRVGQLARGRQTGMGAGCWVLGRHILPVRQIDLVA